MEHGATTHISGRWENQLTSRVRFVTSNGSITGTFTSGVGAAGTEHALTGFYDPSPRHGSCTLGFVVSWPDEHSVTVWSGHYEAERDVIVATWLLSSDTARGDWRSTTIGHDEFRRLREEE
jgi:hypothetical protein